MATVRFSLDKRRLTVGDWVTLEEMQAGEQKARDLLDMLARQVVDDDGRYLEHAKALRMLRGYPMEEFAAVLDAFQEAFRDVAVNPTSAEPS